MKTQKKSLSYPCVVEIPELPGLSWELSAPATATARFLRSSGTYSCFGFSAGTSPGFELQFLGFSGTNTGSEPLFRFSVTGFGLFSGFTETFSFSLSATRSEWTGRTRKARLEKGRSNEIERW
jgi:hypothetical protein